MNSKEADYERHSEVDFKLEGHLDMSKHGHGLQRYKLGVTFLL